MFVIGSRSLTVSLRSSPGPLGPGDCFIRALIFVEVVPESVSLPVLQHKIWNFYIKYGMSHIETTHVPSLHLTMSATIHYIQRLLE